MRQTLRVPAKGHRRQGRFQSHRPHLLTPRSVFTGAGKVTPCYRDWWAPSYLFIFIYTLFHKGFEAMFAKEVDGQQRG